MFSMTDTTLRIASYNIRKARGLDQKYIPNRTVQVINQLDADIVVLQEADKRLGDRKPAIPRALIERETDFQIVELSENEISLGWHGNAVLVRDLSKVLRIERLVLPGLEPRGAIRLDMKIGDGFSIVATHLGLLRRHRRAQLNALCDATANSVHTLIAGDFNEWSRRKGLEPLADRFEVHAPGQSFHARRPVAALDRIALSRGIDLVGAGVEQGKLAKRASDHLPIWADLVIPSERVIC